MKVFTIKEISDYLKVSQQTIRQKVKQLQKNKLLFVSYDTDGRIRLDVEQVGVLIATFYKSVYNVYCETHGIQKGETVIPTRKGTIQRLKRKNGVDVFYIRNLPLAYDHEGKEIIYKSPKFNTKADAEEEQARLLANRISSARKLETEQSRDENAHLKFLREQRFKMFCEQWVETKEIRESTRSSYFCIIKQFLKDFPDIQIKELTAGVINERLLQCKKNTHVTYIVLLGILTSLYKRDAIDRNIIDKLERPKRRRRHSKIALTEEQVLELLQLVEDSKYKLLIHLLFKTGIRISEALAITADDVVLRDKNRIELRINKTLSTDSLNKEVTIQPPKTESGNRIVYVKDVVLYDLLSKVVHAHKGLLFTGRHGSYLPSITIRVLFKRLGEQLGVNITPHTARHTYISISLSKGIDIYSIVAQVGHRDATTIFTVYGKLIKDRAEIFNQISVINDDTQNNTQLSKN